MINHGGAKQSVISKLMKEQRQKAPVAYGIGEKKVIKQIEVQREYR